MDRARAAKRHATAELGAGHTEDVAHHPQHRRVVVDIDAVCLPIDCDAEGHDVLSFSTRRSAVRSADLDAISGAIRPEAWRRIYWTMVSTILWHQSARQSRCTRSRDPTNSRGAIGGKRTNCLLVWRLAGPEKPRWRDGHESCCWCA